MAAVGVPFHAATTSSSSMAYLPACQSHGSSFSASPSLDDPVFDLSDFVMLDQAEFVAPARAAVPSLAVDGGRDHQNSSLGNLIGNSSGTNTNARYRSGGGVLEGGGGREITSRIAFRMKSEVEILDDGFKWRKYGKKSVKNSPNPRNYYRCSTEGCRVKKRVERDREDPSYVITTYEGTHNHTSPDVVYYTTQDAVSGRYYVAGCSRMPTPASN